MSCLFPLQQNPLQKKSYYIFNNNSNNGCTLSPHLTGRKASGTPVQLLITVNFTVNTGNTSALERVFTDPKRRLKLGYFVGLMEADESQTFK